MSKPVKKIKYKNITISGLPGAGSTTLAKSLSNHLGWKYFSGGDFLRQYAIKNKLFDGNQKIHHDQSIMPDEADRQVDYGMRKTVQQKSSNVLDSWLSGFMTYGVSGVLRILVVCSNDNVRVDRIVNRDDLSIAEAKHHIFDREAKNRQKWTRMYAQEWQDWVVKKEVVEPDDPIDFWDPRLYDFIIDTFSNSKDQTLKKVLEELEDNGEIT